MPSQFNKHVNDLSKDTKEYIESLIAFYKLDAYKKSAKGVSVLLRFVIFAGFFLLFFAFLLVGIALLVGNYLNSYYLGFFSMALFNIILIILVSTIGKKWIEKIVLSFFAEIFEDFRDNED